VQVVLFGGFAGGKPSTLKELWPMMPNLKWVHALAAGVDNIVPVLRECDGVEKIPVSHYSSCFPNRSAPQLPSRLSTLPQWAELFIKTAEEAALRRDDPLEISLLLPLPQPLQVSNAKGAFSSSLAEWCITAFLHFDKQIVRVQKNRAERVWDKFIMSELRGKTVIQHTNYVRRRLRRQWLTSVFFSALQVGFVGFGSIAQATARLCKGFGMRILALRRSKEGPGSELADEVFGYDDGKLAVFEQADFVVCSLPGTPQTLKFCGAAEFAAMKPSGVFVSIGRGVCVDEEALCTALQSKSILGAACDVFAVEPLPEESGLWDCDNVILTAHNADNTHSYMRDSWAVYRTNFARFEKGEEIPRISLEHGY